MLFRSGTHVVNGAIYQLPYDLLTDLEPVAMIATNPQILVGKNAIPAKTLKELLVWVKANQDKAAIGTGGAGTPAHVSAAHFQTVTGTTPQIVHYRGAAPAMQDILAGQIDLMFDQAANSLPQVRGAKSVERAQPMSWFVLSVVRSGGQEGTGVGIVRVHPEEDRSKGVV